MYVNYENTPTETTAAGGRNRNSDNTDTNAGAQSITGNFEDEKGIDDDLNEALNTTNELDISLDLRSFVEKKKGAC